MKKELDEKLCRDYPKIFRDRHGNMRTTAMCWGFECGDGWYPLIDALCKSLQWDTDKNGAEQVVATQVKEKYGSLCFYTNACDNRQAGMIDFAESISRIICEVCGGPGSIDYDAGWLSCRCKEHGGTING